VAGLGQRIRANAKGLTEQLKGGQLCAASGGGRGIWLDAERAPELVARDGSPGYVSIGPRGILRRGAPSETLSHRRSGDRANARRHAPERSRGRTPVDFRCAKLTGRTLENADEHHQPCLQNVLFGMVSSHSRRDELGPEHRRGEPWRRFWTESRGRDGNRFGGAVAARMRGCPFPTAGPAPHNHRARELFDAFGSVSIAYILPSSSVMKLTPQETDF